MITDGGFIWSSIFIEKSKGLPRRQEALVCVCEAHLSGAHGTGPPAVQPCPPQPRLCCIELPFPKHRCLHVPLTLALKPVWPQMPTTHKGSFPNVPPGPLGTSCCLPNSTLATSMFSLSQHKLHSAFTLLYMLLCSGPSLTKIPLASKTQM